MVCLHYVVHIVWHLQLCKANECNFASGSLDTLRHPLRPVNIKRIPDVPLTSHPIHTDENVQSLHACIHAVSKMYTKSKFRKTNICLYQSTSLISKDKDRFDLYVHILSGFFLIEYVLFIIVVMEVYLAEWNNDRFRSF